MDLKSAFLNGYINELVYIEQTPVLKTLGTPSMFTGCPRRSMVKLLELAMRGLGTSSLRRASRLGKLTQHSSPIKLMGKSSFAKFMFMILFLLH